MTAETGGSPHSTADRTYARCIHAYAAGSETEISLQVGDIVRLLSFDPGAHCGLLLRGFLFDRIFDQYLCFYHIHRPRMVARREGIGGRNRYAIFGSAFKTGRSGRACSRSSTARSPFPLDP